MMTAALHILSTCYGRAFSNAKLSKLRYYMGFAMIETLLQAILEQVDQPKKDLEHNLRALLNEAVSHMDLVSQEEIERQRTALKLANARLDQLMQQIEQLQ